MLDNGAPSFHALLFQWSARASMIAFEMVFPAVLGVGFDQLCGTAPLLAVCGAVFGAALGFWQLLKIAQREESAMESLSPPPSEPPPTGVDKFLNTRDNDPV